MPLNWRVRKGIWQKWSTGFKRVVFFLWRGMLCAWGGGAFIINLKKKMAHSMNPHPPYRKRGRENASYQGLWWQDNPKRFFFLWISPDLTSFCFFRVCERIPSVEVLFFPTHPSWCTTIFRAHKNERKSWKGGGEKKVNFLFFGKRGHFYSARFL